MKRGTDSAQRRLTVLALALLIATGLAACHRTQERDEARADSGGTPAAGAVADSLSAAASGDSAAADTTAKKEAPGKGGLLGGLFSRKKEEPKKEEPVPVELAEVSRQDLPYYLTGTATLEPENQAEILAKIQGEIRQILVEEGARVSEGQLLAVLDGAAQEVAVEEADAGLRALELDLERVRSLHVDQLASDKDLHNAESNFEQAAARKKAATLQLDYTQIRSPFAGQITERFVDRGQTVSPGTRLFSVVDADPLLARIYLPEKEAARIRTGQTVLISPDTHPSLQVPGEVLRVAPMVDPRTGTVKVTCHLSGATEDLRPGSFVRTQIATETHRGVLSIPKRAVLHEGAETYVFRAVADSVVKVLVTLGTGNHRLVEVSEGLQAGDRIIVVGQGALKPGSKFREIARDSTSGAEADSGLRESM